MFWDFLGKVISPVTELGGQWLRNRKDVSKAKADLKVAELGARMQVAKNRADMEIKVLEGTQTLDEIAVRQQGKSWWDEFMTLILLAPLLLIFYGVCVQTPVEAWGVMLFAALDSIPQWYVALIFLAYINYFGYRSLLRAVIKAYGAKMNPVSWFKKPKEENKNGG